jgi:serine/threonine protein kinase
MAIGGRLFDRGMYGCIFQPSLLCKNKDPEDKEKIQPLSISKLLLKEDANIEHFISKVIHKIPLWKNYYAVSESICEPKEVQKDPELSKCPLLDKYDLYEFRILSMTYAGKPFSGFKFSFDNFDIMKFTIHLLEGCALLNMFGIVHRDLHQGNILIDTYNVPRIIDFNLAIPVEGDLDKYSLSHSHELDISQEPPDSTLVNAIKKGLDPYKIIQDIVHKKRIVKKIKMLFGISNQVMLSSLNDFYMKSKSVKKGDCNEWFKSYWRTIDSWAVGINIADLIIKLSISSTFSQHFSKYKTKLFAVLKRMCECNPLLRIDAIQALNYLDPTNFIIRKYGNNWLEKVGDGKI